MSRNMKEKTAARALQAALGCSYSTALAKVREDLRAAQEKFALEHMTPLEVVVDTEGH